MKFRVTVVDRASGGRKTLPVQAPDERSAGWAVLQRGMEVLSIDRDAAPAPRPVGHVAPPLPRPGPSEYGTASLFVCGTTVVLSLIIFFAALAASWTVEVWLMVGFVVNLVGSLSGLALAQAGQSKGDRLAALGIVCNLIVGSPSLLALVFFVGFAVTHLVYR